MQWESITGGGLVAALLALLGTSLRTRISKLESRMDTKVDAKVCEEKQQKIEMQLGYGAERFDKLENKMDEVIVSLAEVKSTLDILAKNRRNERA